MKGEIMSDALRAGVIGIGILGRRHSRELDEDERVDLVALADLKEEVVEEAAAEYGCLAYTDYEEMLAKEDLDLVAVATPDPFHKAPVVACAEAGVKNVMLQKPMATTVEDAEAMVSAAEEAGTNIYMIFATRWSPANVATHYVMRNGLIGEPVWGEVLTDDSIRVPREMWGEGRKTWASSSSSAHFLHSHLVDRLRWYMAPAEVENVFAMSQKKVLGFSPDLYDSFIFFDNGFKARVKTGWIHYIEGGVENRSLYNATEGQIINNTSPAFGLETGWRVNVSDKVSLEELVACQQSLSEKGVGSRVIDRKTKITGWTKGVERALELEMRGNLNPNPTEVILDAIVEGTYTPESWVKWQGEGSLPSAVDGLEQTKIVCAIIESAETGEVVEVD
jgi:predicted dehydrogenase